MNIIDKNIQLVGINRGNEYSPNHIDNDAAIFQAVTLELEKRNCNVKIYSEKDFVDKNIEADYIFNMARDPKTIQLLKNMEKKGTVVINSAFGIENCIRKPMTELLIQHQIPYPESYIISSNDSFNLNQFPYWIKRGNSHALVKNDVVYVECKEEAECALADFKQRGIPEAVVNKHLIGDLIKFYGVQGTDFFYTFYPTEQSHSKFGLEAINGACRGYHFDKKKLQKMSNRAVEVLNVPIYGGDCVVSSNGDIKIIDFNDWPSFARCRKEAAPFIAECIYNRIMNHLKK